MNRRALLTGSGLWLAAPIASAVPTPEDEAGLKKAIAEVYRVYSRLRDKAKYRALLTEDYLLLENGQLLDAAGDVAAMRAPEEPYDRTDTFDFRHARVTGDEGYLVYYLDSVIRMPDGTQHRRWLESAVLRRSGSRWLLALLHSTRIGER